ncbi:zwei Ig domain protein zig-8-like isoform X2 [Vespula squamosa]|uniref:Zwei Ig domain protein zig-8-like isoform X2 n=1 Tax=Vespula squamosa TaxID=30214 RepID=A0ABD2B6U6_VESSQ
MHILSAGILMYTSDLRFLVIHPENSENWTLQIKSPQERDSGVYECQASSNEKKVTEDSSSDENFSDFVARKSEESLEKKKIMPDTSDVGKSTAVHRKRTTGFDV